MVRFLSCRHSAKKSEPPDPSFASAQTSIERDNTVCRDIEPERFVDHSILAWLKLQTRSTWPLASSLALLARRCSQSLGACSANTKDFQIFLRDCPQELGWLGLTCLKRQETNLRPIIPSGDGVVGRPCWSWYSVVRCTILSTQTCSAILKLLALCSHIIIVANNWISGRTKRRQETICYFYQSTKSCDHHQVTF